MRPRTTLFQVALALTAFTFLVAYGWSPKSRIVLPQDKGPEKVDVADYPQELQDAYKTFRRVCSRCHTLARPINTTMRPDYWARYVGIMVDKSPEPISAQDALQITQFLIYDQQIRKDKDPAALFPPLTEEDLQKLRDQAQGSAPKS